MIDEEFFRDRLRTLRNERQVSAREMSLALGQNESYINKIESGKATTTIPSFEYYLKRLSPNQAKYILELLKDITKNS